MSANHYRRDRVPMLTASCGPHTWGNAAAQTEEATVRNDSANQTCHASLFNEAGAQHLSPTIAVVGALSNIHPNDGPVCSLVHLRFKLAPCKIKLGPLRARFGQRRMPDASAQLIRWLGVGTAKAHGEPKCLGSQQSTKGSKDRSQS